MTMGNRIAKARKEKGFTQEYVAASLDVSRQAVYKWEKDQSKPDTSNLIALSDLLGVSVDYLTRGEDPTALNNGRTFFIGSLIPLFIMLICGMIGLLSGEYTDMVMIPLPSGLRYGIPFLMYGRSPAAILLMIISIVVPDSVCAAAFPGGLFK